MARNDQPLPPKEQQQEDEKLQRSIEQRRKETPEQKERRIADWKRKQEKQREPLRELPDAFDFRLAGEENIAGVPAYVIDASPKPGYKPRSSIASFFPKVKARFWIDKKDYQWAKVDMETLDTITFGGILVRLAKGSHLVMEQARVNQEVWLPRRISMQASGAGPPGQGLPRGHAVHFQRLQEISDRFPDGLRGRPAILKLRQNLWVADTFERRQAGRTA